MILRNGGTSILICRRWLNYPPPMYVQLLCVYIDIYIYIYTCVCLDVPESESDLNLVGWK